MKTFWVFILIFNICLTGFAQMEFAPIGAEWYYSQYESFNPPQANYIKHSCIKDSIIAGKNVKVIQKTLYRRDGPVSMGYEYLYQSGDTISYWKSGEFHVLYNFSLSKGDSILLYSEMPDYCEPKSPYGWANIDSVYTKPINNRSLKAYFCSNKKGYNWTYDGFPIIEKIGSTLYLLPQMGDCIQDAPGIGPLRCYSDPDLGSYYYENLPCDTITTFPDSFIPLGRNLKIKIFPNPVQDDLFIEWNDLQPMKLDFRLFDVNGKLVHAQTFSSKERIVLSCIPQGVYLVSIFNNNKLYYNGIICKN